MIKKDKTLEDQLKSIDLEILDFINPSIDPLGDETPEENQNRRMAVKDYLNFLKLDPLTQEQIKLAWKDYYEEIKNTISYKSYQEMKLLFNDKNTDNKSKNLIRIKELASQARQRIEDGNYKPYPTERDPREFTHSQDIISFKMLSNKRQYLMEQIAREEKNKKMEVKDLF